MFDDDSTKGFINRKEIIEEANKRADVWISVKDRLPKECRCLVYSPIYNENSEMTMRIIDSQFVKLLTDATHWMPLPEPPKQ